MHEVFLVAKSTRLSGPNKVEPPPVASVEKKNWHNLSELS